MKRITKLAFGLCQMVAVCLLLAACADNDSLWSGQEGLPVSIKCKLTTWNPNQVTTRATDQQETKVEKLALLFYKDNGSKPIVYEVPDMGQPTEVTSTNYLYSIEVPESAGLTSGQWYMYAVTNWDKGFWDRDMTLSDLAGMTKAEMDKYCILKKYKTLDITETAILLTGRYGTEGGLVTFERTDDNQGVNTLQEKVHLRRSVAKVIFNFTNGTGVTFKPEKYELHNYCRTQTLMERSGWNGPKGTAPGSLQWNGAEGDDSWTEGERPVTDGSFMFYMPENVQTAKSTFTDKMMREKKTNGNGAFTYAPDRGTYVVVSGRYEGPGKTDGHTVTANVRYTIFLGDFSDESGSADNYTVRRNTRYTFNVTVNGVNNIITECTTESEPQPGAEGDVIISNKENTVLLDAHYETRILKISKAAISGLSKYALVIKTPKSNVFDNDGTQNIANEDINWVKFGKPASATTYNAYPKDVNQLINLSELLVAFKNNDYSDYCVDGNDYIYIQAYVDEYFYTDIARNKFINAPNRVITISSGTKQSQDGLSSYTETPIFSIQQRSIKSVFDLATNNPFGLESVEEPAVACSLAMNAANGETFEGTDMDNGWANFKKIITGTSWSTYIDYTTNSMKTGYNYGLYQGLLRNKDENGNGVIDESELKWFLPSANQHQAIWAGVYALSNEARLNTGDRYWTSTQGYRVMWAEEGSCGPYNSSWANDGHVRCIRALGTYNAATTKVSKYNAATRIITMSSLADNTLRPSGSQVGEYLFHNQYAAENKLPEAFQVARANLTVTTGAYAGDNYVPTVTFTKNSGSRTGNNNNNYKYTVNVDLQITRVNGKKYYWATTVNGQKTEITGSELTNMTVMAQANRNNNYTYSDLYIFADNGNYVMIRSNTNQAPTAQQTTTVIDANKPSAGTTRSTFTVAEISKDNLCKDYYEEEDQSDKGQWRIPNQRELMVMMVNLGTNLSKYTASRSYYDKRDASNPSKGMYFLVGDNSLNLTSNQSGLESYPQIYVIRPVRDAQPEKTSAGYDSGYAGGGSIIK